VLPKRILEIIENTQKFPGIIQNEFWKYLNTKYIEMEFKFIQNKS
jgi:hypothetical protein